MNIYEINLGFVNAYLIGEENYILIDTGLKSHANKILSFMEKHHIGPEKVKLIILTHAHEDHIGGLKEIQQKTQAKVLMSLKEYNCAILKEKSEIIPLSWMTKVIFFLTRNVQPKPLDLKVDYLIDDTFELSQLNLYGTVVLTPGHTEGSITYIVNHEAFIGDNLMAFFPWQKPKYPILAHNLQLIKESMEKLLQMDISEFHCSHGKTYSAKEIEKSLRSF